LNKSARFATKDGRTLIIRPFADSDLDSLLKFANSLVREKKTNRDLGITSFDKRLSRDFERKFLNSTLEGMKNRKVVSVAAFSGRELVGECLIRGRESSDLAHTGLLGIVVLDRYRGVGLGKKLAGDALQAARKVGIWLVELEVLGINQRAIRLYEKLGFRRVGIVPDKVCRGGRYVDMVVMYADLRQMINPP